MRHIISAVTQDPDGSIAQTLWLAVGGVAIVVAAVVAMLVQRLWETGGQDESTAGFVPPHPAEPPLPSEPDPAPEPVADP